MANIRTRITNVVMKLSYQERRRRKLDAYKNEMQRLKQLDNDELKFEYIELKSKCERKNENFTLFLISIAIAILMNVWSKFFSFMQKALEYASESGLDSMEIAKVSFIISVTLAVFVTVIIFSILFSFVNDISNMKKKLMLLDEAMNEKGITVGTH